MGDSTVVRVSRLVLGLVLSLVLLAPSADAQQAPSVGADPPALGASVVEDPLAGPGSVRASTCPTGRNAAQFVPDGFMLKVTGKCAETVPTAAITSSVDGLTFPDGDVRVEMRAASGMDRLGFRLWFRVNPRESEGYLAVVAPGGGVVQLIRRAGGSPVVLAERRGLPGLLPPDAWTSFAVRTQGPNIWLLLNDEPVLSAADSTYPSGGVAFDLLRLGSPDDEQETAIVLRNLRVAGLEGGDQALAPTHQVATPAPAPAAAPAATPSRPAPSGEPWIGDVAFGYDPSGNGAVPAGGSLKLADGGTIYVFFSWRNLPPGSMLRIERFHGKEQRGDTEYVPTDQQGRFRWPIIVFEAASGGAQYVAGDVSAVIWLNGAEVARGGVAVN